MELTQMIAEYIAKTEEYEAKEETIKALVAKRENQLNWAKKRLAKLKYPSRIETVIEPIAKEMLKKMPDRYYEILGPFGMDSITAIHFYKKDVPETKQLLGDNCISITFVLGYRDSVLGLKDYTADTHTYGEGSIAEMNDMNYPTVPLKDSIDELMEWMKQQNAKKEVMK